MSYTVTKLRALLKKRHLSVVGRKLKLVERYENSIKFEHGVTKDCQIILTRIDQTNGSMPNNGTKDSSKKTNEVMLSDDAVESSGTNAMTPSVANPIETYEQQNKKEASEVMRSDDAVKDSYKRVKDSGKRAKDSGKRAKESVKRVKDSGTKAVTPSVAKPTDEQQNNKETNEVVRSDDAKNDSGTNAVTPFVAKPIETDEQQNNKEASEMMRSDYAVEGSGTNAMTPSVANPIGTDEQKNNKEASEVMRSDDAVKDSDKRAKDSGKRAKDFGTKPVTRSMAKKNKTDDKQLEKPVKRAIESVCDGVTDELSPPVKKMKVDKKIKKIKPTFDNALIIKSARKTSKKKVSTELCLQPSLQQFEIVWAHVRGFRNWPGVIEEVALNGKFVIHFFGDHTRSQVGRNKLMHLLEGFKDYTSAGNPTTLLYKAILELQMFVLEKNRKSCAICDVMTLKAQMRDSSLNR